MSIAGAKTADWCGIFAPEKAKEVGGLKDTRPEKRPQTQPRKSMPAFFQEAG